MYWYFSIVFFHSAGLDVLQMEKTTFSLGHSVRRILYHAITFFGGSWKTAFMCHHCPRPSRNFVIGNACTAGHYSGHATPSLGWVWLPCGCVSCGPRCTHWRIVINAEILRQFPMLTCMLCPCRVRNTFLRTFEIAPLFCVCPIYTENTKILVNDFQLCPFIISVLKLPGNLRSFKKTFLTENLQEVLYHHRKWRLINVFTYNIK
jgi:hypothetical protein